MTCLNLPTLSLVSLIYRVINLSSSTRYFLTLFIDALMLVYRHYIEWLNAQLSLAIDQMNFINVRNHLTSNIFR